MIYLTYDSFSNDPVDDSKSVRDDVAAIGGRIIVVGYGLKKPI